ncbi:MAG: tetratricopeptide repeat protein [Myxococcales bacterium]|nr:tetratricopeptide repeat protein [Myxococcales bacterium]
MSPAAVDEVTPAMHLWAVSAVGTGTVDARLDRLLEALREPAFGLVYDPGRTGTAREVFETRRYNCLSLTVLFVALARDLGMDADYLEVDRETSYTKDGSLVLVTSHVTAGWGPPARRHVAEIGVDPDTDHLVVRKVDDARIEASWWTNRCAELLRDGDVEGALDAARMALELDDRLGPAWVNLGVARRRHGDQDGAERAYRRAIELEPDQLSAWRNLGMLLRLEGRTDAAAELLSLADRPGRRDPFTLLVLGDWSLEAGDVEGADRFFRRAWTLAPNHPEILAARAEAALGAGELERAWRWSRRAQRADADNPRVAAVLRQLEGS